MTEVLPDGRLSRETVNGPTSESPIRIIHMGLGAFHRAHQAWYTAHASDSAKWGIAAFSGRTATAAWALAAQDGLYTLIERGPEGDRTEIISSIVRAFPAEDTATFIELMERPEVALVTLTLTEAGYRLGQDGLPDRDDPLVAADISKLRTAFDDMNGTLSAVQPGTALGRLLLGLEARRRAQAPALAVVPCDNLPRNGTLLRGALHGLAASISTTLEQWLQEGVSVVSTSVDRITPRTTPSDRAWVAAERGYTDDAVVVTEPFSDWVLSGDFPSGRPDWESAGARIVEDIDPWESRKLWMLNGAHTALAALGAVRGHSLVSEAIADPVCRDLVEALWEEGARHLPDLDLENYRAALLSRFGNARLDYRLEQIAQDDVTKIRVRIIPIAHAERQADRSAEGCAAALAAWVTAFRRGLRSGPGSLSRQSATGVVIAELDAQLGTDHDFCRTVDDAIERLSTS